MNLSTEVCYKGHDYVGKLMNLLLENMQMAVDTAEQTV